MDDATLTTALDTRAGEGLRPVRRVELLSGMAGRRRVWTLEQKLALVSEMERCDNIAAFARERDISTALLYGNAWTQERVRGFRHHHEIAGFRREEWAERGEIRLEDAATIVGVCKMTALRMLRRGTIPGRQVCPGAPWVIKAADLIGFAGRRRPAAPLTPNPDQQAFVFQ